MFWIILFLLVVISPVSLTSNFPLRKADGSVDVTNLVVHIALLNDRYSSLEELTETYTADVASLRTEVANLKEENERSNEEKTALQRQMDKSQAKPGTGHLDSQMTNLRYELNETKTELGLVQRDTKACARDVVTLRKEVTNLKADKLRTAEKIRTLQQQMDKSQANPGTGHLDSQLTNLTYALNETKTELGLVAKEVTSLKSKLASLRADYANVTNDIVSDVTESKTNIATLQKDIKIVKSNFLARFDTVHRIDQSKKILTNVMVKAVTDTKSSIEILRKDINTVEHKLRLQVNASNVSISDTNKDLTEVKKYVREKQKEVRLMKEAIADLQAQGNASSVAISNTNRDLAEVKRNVENDQNDVRVMKETIADLKTQGNASSVAISNTNRNLEEVKRNVENDQNDVRVMKETIADLRNKSSLTSTEMSKLTTIVDDLEKEVSFEVRLSSYKRVSDYQIVEFDSIRHNIGGGYNKRSGRFTAPVSGTYLFWSTVFKTAGSYLNVVLFIPRFRIAGSYASAEGGVSVSVMTSTELSAGEHVYVEIKGAINIIGSHWSTFGGVLLHRH